MRFFIVLSIWVWLGAGCSNNTVQPTANSENVEDANEAYYQSIKHHTGLTFLSMLQGADSAQVVMYDNPDGDPKRYTRYFKWYNTTDTTEVSALLQSANQHFERIEKLKECRSQGKIFFFEKGNPLQTIYFSNRGDTCNHTYFIADGWFFYMPMDSSTASLLQSIRPRLKVPPGDY